MALGGLAWQAYRSYQESNPEAAPELSEQSFELDAESSANEIDLIVRAMIAAAHADGQLDDEERTKIWDHALKSEFSTSQLEALSQEINHPVGVAQLAVMAQGMEQKLEVYTASKLVIGDEQEGGAVYLRDLAEALALPRGLILALNQETKDQSAPDQGVAA